MRSPSSTFFASLPLMAGLLAFGCGGGSGSGSTASGPAMPPPGPAWYGYGRDAQPAVTRGA